jgi:hypothetical protein
VLSPRPLLRGVAGVAGVLFCLLALLGPARETDTLPRFLHEALGPPQAAAPLLHHPADGVRVAIKPDHFTVVRGAASVSLAAEGVGNTEWRHFENGATRTTPFGAETVVVDGDKAEQYLTVTERQGLTTWRWMITADGLEPRLTTMGGVELLRNGERSGLRILPARIYGPSGRDVTPSGVHWSLTGTEGSHWLELRLDDANLPLPYVIDPAVDYPSPLYLSSATSTVTGSWQLRGTPDLLGNSSTRTSLCQSCIGYVQWQPGIDNGVAATPTSAPTGNGWIVDASGATGFPAGDWSFTVETDIPDLLVAPGTAILAVGVWKGTVAGGAFTPTQTLLPPTDDPAAQDLRTSVLPVTTTVTYPLPQFSLAAGETLYVEYWRKQISGIDDASLTKRSVDFIVNDGVAKIVHPTGDSTPPERPVLTLTESEPDEHVAGTTLYYNPSGTNTGTFTVDASTGDAESGVSLVEFPAVFGLDSAIDPLAPYQTTYSWTETAMANGAHTVTAVNGGSLQATSSFTVTPDTGAPTVSVTQPADGAAVREGQALEAAAFDTLAGTAEVEFRYCAGVACAWNTATPLGTDAAPPYSLAWSTQPADGTYTLLARAVDNVGNLAESAPITVKVDNTAPSNVVIPQEGFSPGLQHFEAATETFFYNPRASGGFVLSSAADDAGSGVARVDFPRISVTGFRGAAASDGFAPFTSNTYSFDEANAVAPSDAMIVVTDVAGNSTSETISFERDTAPPTGGLVSYADGYQATASVSIETASGTDAGVGIDAASAVLERQTAVLGSGVCGAYGPWEAAVGPDSLPDATCARYRHRVSDQVGNEAVYTSVSLVQADLTPPTAQLVDPGAVLRGTVDLAANASDGASGIASLTYQVSPADANQWTNVAAGWDTTSVADGPYDLRVVATDRAGNATVSTAVRGRRVDNTAPGVEITAPVGYVNAAAADPYPVTAASPDGDVASIEFFRCDDASADCATGGWTSLGIDASAPFAASWNLDADGNRALKAVALDAAGNASNAVVNVTIDRQSPTSGSLSVSHTTSTWSSDSTVDVAFAAPTDAGSGADGFSYHWDLDPAGTPDASKDAEETAGGTTSPPLADGAWYFHLRTVDNAGNWSDTVHAGPFLVDVTAPTPVAVGGWALLQRFILTPAFSVSWSGGDAASGTSSYDVQYRSAGYKGVFGAPVLWQSAVTATSASFTGTPGSTYCFSARALDAVGNLSTWSAEKCTALPLNNTSLAHSSGWSKVTARGYYLKSYSVSSRPGASLTRTGVVAKRIAVVVTKCATCGTLGVYWNGTLLKKLNLAASTTAKKQLITVAGWASPRSGAVKLVVLSSGRPVIVEGLGVRVP